VTGTNDQLRFLQSVGAFGPRVPHARRLAAALQGIVPNPNVDTVPIEVYARVRRLMSDRGITYRQLSAMSGAAYAGSSHFAYAPSRDVLERYATLLDDESLRAVASSDLFWDRVVAVEPAGQEDVFDLTVPGPASWLADSVISHNSGAIEQDSDVVMFIHREDAYNDDPDVKGMADVIVAKHRNGPTDKISLTFLAHLTQFKNYAKPR
jgi:replicative DNA helicase